MTVGELIIKLESLPKSLEVHLDHGVLLTCPLVAVITSSDVELRHKAGITLLGEKPVSG